jgi:hypothetical protein
MVGMKNVLNFNSGFREAEGNRREDFESPRESPFLSLFVQ